MKKYIVYYETVDGDHDSEWTEASNKKEAANNVKREHWDIKKVTYVGPLK